MAHDHDHDHKHDHDHEHGSELSETQLRVRALETILTEKGYVDPKALDAIVEAYETRIGPHNGAKAVAKAWIDPEYKKALLADATKAVGSLGFVSRIGDHLVAVENTPKLHNMIVCTLCSCYPWEVLGLPPTWYKSAPYRSRTVIDPRGVLKDFGVPFEQIKYVQGDTAQVSHPELTQCLAAECGHRQRHVLQVLLAAACGHHDRLLEAFDAEHQVIQRAFLAAVDDEPGRLDFSEPGEGHRQRVGPAGHAGEDEAAVRVGHRAPCVARRVIGERDIGAPHGVVETLGNVRRQRVFGGMAAGAVTTVVAERDRFGERHVEPDRGRHRPRHLRDLERMREARPLMIVGKHEHLRLAGQAPEGCGVEDAVAIAFEGGAVFVGGLVAGSTIWSKLVDTNRRGLFSPHPVKRFAAVSYLGARPSVDTARLLRDYILWEPQPLLRRRARRVLRAVEASLER